MPFFFFSFRKAQFAVEYLLVTGFLFMLLIPSLFILYNYTAQSQEQLSLARANEVGNAMVANAEKVYYYGKGSKLTIQAAMPSLVDRFYYRCVNDKPCEVVFALHDNELGFTTSVPIKADSTCTENKCDFGKTIEDRERFRAPGPKTLTFLHDVEDKVQITIE